MLQGKGLTLCHACSKLMPTKFLLPRELPSWTLKYWVFPIEEHTDQPDVPEFTDVHEEHFNAKSDSHPFSQSPLNMTAKAVLGREEYSPQYWSGPKIALVSTYSYMPPCAKCKHISSHSSHKVNISNKSPLINTLGSQTLQRCLNPSDSVYLVLGPCTVSPSELICSWKSGNCV